VRKEGRYVDGKEDGVWIAYRTNGQRRWVRQYRAGLKAGQWTYYYGNEQKQRVEQYEADRKQGPFASYYDTGQLQEEGAFEVGNKHGRWRRHRADGSVEMEEHFLLGKRHGLAEFCAADGSVVSSGEFVDGQVASGTFVVLSQARQVRGVQSYKDGLRHGKWLLYADAGALREERHYQQDRLNGEAVGYYESGQRSYVGHYRDDQRQGPWTDYYENGATAYTGQYHADLKQGSWMSFDADGQLRSEAEFDAGVRDRADMIQIGDTDLWLDAYEATNAQVVVFLNEVGNLPVKGAALVEVRSAFAGIEARDGEFLVKEGLADHPAVEVSFEGARAFCEWAGKRLPAGEEWQAACTGPDEGEFPWGSVRGDDQRQAQLANLVGDADGFARTAPVGSFAAGRSPYGLWDMGGNVWEWTRGSEGQPMLRGGSFGNGAAHTQCARKDDPSDSHSYFKANSVGFRCARYASCADGEC